MDYKPLSLSDIETLRPYFEKNPCRICDCTIGGTFMWRELYKTEYALRDKTLYLKVVYLPGVPAFTPPHGDIPDEAEAYETIREECRALGIPPRVCAVSEGRLQSLLEIYPNAQCETDRAWSDYLYRSEDYHARRAALRGPAQPHQRLPQGAPGLVLRSADGRKPRRGARVFRRPL